MPKSFYACLSAVLVLVMLASPMVRPTPLVSAVAVPSADARP